ncbi:MAG TPA: hypothetical protein VK157_03050 [Phycisphaerales bacterium]|nr:hypothetical protein [Phycisphaerales bacterium]
MTRIAQTVVLSAALLATAAFAQPVDFADLGAFAAPLSPPSQISGTAFSLGGRFIPEELTVKWYRFTITEELSAPAFLQVTTTASTGFAVPGNVSLAFYDATGNLVATEFGGVSAGLSFGSTIAGPRSNGGPYGRDGATLAAGEYYVAVAAGGAGNVTAGATNWDVTTNASLTLDLNNIFTSYAVTLALSFGNSDPRSTTGPANDTCANAEVVTDGQFWIGSNDLANADADFACFQPRPDEVLRDVWFSFTPTVSGVATASSNVQDVSAAVLPALARYEGCGQPSVQCGQIFVENGNPGTRLVFDAIAGQRYLIALGGFQGSTGPINFTVNVAPSVGCDSIDFNNNTVFPEDQDVIDFFSVLAGGECSAGNTCNDIDFNNNTVFPEDQDVIDFFNVLAGGECV